MTAQIRGVSFEEYDEKRSKSKRIANVVMLARLRMLLYGKSKLCREYQSGDVFLSN